MIAAPLATTVEVRLDRRFPTPHFPFGPRGSTVSGRQKPPTRLSHRVTVGRLAVGMNAATAIIIPVTMQIQAKARISAALADYRIGVSSVVPERSSGIIRRMRAPLTS